MWVESCEVTTEPTPSFQKYKKPYRSWTNSETLLTYKDWSSLRFVLLGFYQSQSWIKWIIWGLPISAYTFDTLTYTTRTLHSVLTHHYTGSLVIVCLIFYVPSSNLPSVSPTWLLSNTNTELVRMFKYNRRYNIESVLVWYLS